MAYDKQKKWTVMVFMGAATIEGEEDLLDAAEDDLLEMASVGSGRVQSTNAEDADAELNIFVQVYARESSDKDNRKTSARFGKIEQRKVDPNEKRQVGEVFKTFGEKVDGPSKDKAPSGPEAVEQFVRKALGAAGHQPENPNHYSMFVLWGHAYDFAIGRALSRDGTIDALDFAELSTVLERLQQNTDAKLDILGFDACALATVEMACQLEPFAKYLLASQIGIPIPGFPYDRILDRLRNPYGKLMNPLEFGSYAVRRFCESYTAESLTVSLTLLNLERVSDLGAHTEYLASTLTSVTGNPGARDRIAYLIAQSQTDAGQPFVDLGDLCFNLVRSSGDAHVIESARALGDLLISPPGEAVGKRSGDPVDQNKLPFVIEHGRNSGQTARLNGISVYAPHLAPHRNFNTLQHLYLNFEFAKTQWSGLMHSLARLG